MYNIDKPIRMYNILTYFAFIMGIIGYYFYNNDISLNKQNSDTTSFYCIGIVIFSLSIAIYDKYFTIYH